MYSFDIFDTLITRDLASPEGIFTIMQRILRGEGTYRQDVITLPPYVRNNFYQLRIHAEEIARETYRKQGYEDILLPKIYEAFTLLGNLKEEQISWLMELENSVELEHAAGIEENLLYLHRLVECGEKVVLISDMYLEERVIRKMLLKADPFLADIPLYVSAQWNKTKFSGSLYDMVRERELPEGQEWIHIGDNLFSDERQAVAKGIQGKLYHGEELSAWEKRAIKQYPNHAEVQLRVGVSRLARRRLAADGSGLHGRGLGEESGGLHGRGPGEESGGLHGRGPGEDGLDLHRRELDEESRHSESYRLTDAQRIGCSIGGNILVPYIYWVLQVSREKGFTRLYFIARDGFLLKKVADILIKIYHLDIQTKYIYGSRKAWRIPAVGSFLDGESFHDIYKMIYWSHPKMVDSVGKLAAVLGLEEEELYPFLPEGCRHGKTDSGEYVNQNLCEGAVRELALMLDRNEEFRLFLKGKHAGKRLLLQKYLQQELDLSDPDFAFVDLSGGGFSQRCLSEIMRDLTDAPMRFFYFRLDQMFRTDTCVPYVFIPGKLEGSLIVEMMCRAPHGQTERYQWENGGNGVEPGMENREVKLCPVLSKGEEAALQGHGYMEFAAGVLAYALEYGRVAADLDGGNDLTLTLHYMKEIVERPDKEVLDFFAGMPNNVTGRENRIIEYAPHLSKDELTGIFLLRGENESLEKYYPYSCLEYSLLRCSEEERAYIEYCKVHYRDAVWVKEREKRVPEKNLYGRAAYFPCVLLREKVVLYGAGKYGCDLYGKIWDWPYGEVVLWVDAAVRERQFRGKTVEVKQPDAVASIDFQQIVIAVAQEQAAREIYRELVKQGIDKDKILWWPMYLRGVEWGV